MATWQATFNLIPRGTTVPEALDANLAFLEIGSAESELSAFSDRGSSWSTNLQAWGPDDGNRLEIWKDDGAIESIQVRFDLRSSIRDFVKGVLAFAQRHQLVLYSQELNETIEPTPEELASALRRSSAFGFVSDPKAYLQSLPRNVG